MRPVASSSSSPTVNYHHFPLCIVRVVRGPRPNSDAGDAGDAGTGRSCSAYRAIGEASDSLSGPAMLVTEGSGASLSSEAASTPLPAHTYQHVGLPRNAKSRHIPVPVTRPDSTLLRASGRSLSNGAITR